MASIRGIICITQLQLLRHVLRVVHACDMHGEMAVEAACMLHAVWGQPEDSSVLHPRHQHSSKAAINNKGEKRERERERERDLGARLREPDDCFNKDSSIVDSKASSKAKL